MVFSGTFDVPRTQGPIKLDGDCNEPSWQFAFHSPDFLDSRGSYVPHAELRALADDDNLYLEIYVADEDLQSNGDRLQLEVGPLHMVLTPKSATLPAGVRLATDLDGTLDDPKDLDEEWVSELAIPWALLGSHEVPVRALRIDVGKGHEPHALAWPATAPALLRFRAAPAAAPASSPVTLSHP